MIRDPDPGKQGMTTNCPAAPIWRGHYRDRSGKWWPRVESCNEHADELLDVRRLLGPLTAPDTAR
jgi:hypothetical protein